MTSMPQPNNAGRPWTEYQAVIFDMDGVIVDSEPRHERAFLQVLDEIGHRGPLPKPFSHYIGRTDRDVWVDFIEAHQPPHSIEELLARKRERVMEILRREKPIFDGLPELVHELAGRGTPLGLASGSERPVVETVLELAGIGGCFRATVTGSEVIRGKPDPEIFLRTAGLLGVCPADCVVIEDSKPGVRAALAAGMRVVAITNTHPAEELQQASFVVSACEEVRELLGGAGAGQRQ